MKSLKLKIDNVVRAAFLSVLALVSCDDLAATPQTLQTSQTFDIVALVDSLDFAKNYDIET